MSDKRLVDASRLHLVAYETPGAYPVVGHVETRTYHYVYRRTGTTRAVAAYAPGDDVDRATWYS